MLEIEMCDQAREKWNEKVISEIVARVNKVQLIKQIKLEIIGIIIKVQLKVRIKLLSNQFNETFVDVLRENILESVQIVAYQVNVLCL